MSVEHDRRASLLAQDIYNGIDYVEVVTATQLRAHFLTPVPDANALEAAYKRESLKIVDLATGVPLDLIGRAWDVGPHGRPMLTIDVVATGGFSTHKLSISTKPGEQPLLDPYFDSAEFSFKALCETTIDCRPLEPECGPSDATLPPIDYLAKDFDSFRRALSEFSTLRYPQWQERAEPDFGVMFMEALASVADDLSYLQDRIGAEAWLDTASERRSLVRLARLVDYEPRVATCARTYLAFTVVGSLTEIPAGLGASAIAADGSVVEFETGTSIDDDSRYPVREAWNRMEAYWWDDQDRCLFRGATSMWVKLAANADPPKVGQWLVIDTAPERDGNPPVRQVVRVREDSELTHDALYDEWLVELMWDDELTEDRDLTRTSVRANVVPAVQGRRERDYFTTTTAWPPVTDTSRAIVRTGAAQTTQFLYTLREAPLGWLAGNGPRPQPELILTDTATGALWKWSHTLLDVGGERNRYTLEPMRYRSVTPKGAELTYHNLGAVDYDGSAGDTVRFGDEHFGGLPGDGTVFEALYRVGGGARGNVAADSIVELEHDHPAAAGVVAVTNPLAAQGGRDQESDASIRENAPQQFRDQQYRAVRAQDYEDVAHELSWVQRAGTEFRYTGSWLTVFTAADPVGQVQISPTRQAELTELLNRRRLAGYESYVLAPRYAAIDVRIMVCAMPDAYRGDVRRAVFVALDASRHADGTAGFFHPDHFTFGEPLERSALEAAVQACYGVAGVTEIEYRRRGHTNDYEAMPDTVAIGRHEIVRVDNDPRHPGGGSLQVVIRGGK